ncbi:glycosyltransferase [Palleniella muris]|uniref:Glycosyltransferase n=1 Tax=Palleniella muris TaxID=3038145 RepID=A0AC61QQT0_9BACT|nr:glycosyltransferase [Palleniella muris]TGX82359.1 glycosyltransferase [Palleniella muris]
MRILYVLRHDPWGIGGGCFASRNYLEAFCEVFSGSEIDALVCAEYLAHGKAEEFPDVCFRGVGERGMLAKLLSPVTGEMHRFQSAASELLYKEKYDLCIFDHNSIAGSLVRLCRKRGVRTIVLNHNCEQEYYRDNFPSRLNRTVFLPIVRRNERRAYRLCDCNVFLTEEDRDLFAELYGESATAKVVGGCFMKKGECLDQLQLKPFSCDRLRMVISGTVGNVQNLDGINYFLDELYAYVPKDMDIVIAGKNPPVELVERLRGYENIELIPNPEDMDAVLRNCDIFLCPTRLGGGMKLRVMDGFRNGMPVIAHKVSARGYSAFKVAGCLQSFGDEEEFGRCLKTVIDDIKSSRMDKETVVRHTMDVLGFEAAVVRLQAVK